MGIDILTLIELAFATWYVSYAVTSSHGPYNVFEWIREHVPHGRTSQSSANPRMHGWPEGEPIPPDIKKSIITYDHNGLLDCPVCLAFWVALLLVWVTTGRIDIVQSLAVAGAAMLAHSWSGWRFGGG